ncbi:MAG TPA: hypothetical protein VMB80_18240 [Candidatus Acidoferrum sp.]|nr:hypothetical protein [Candidatus Acidoferrum sp.]
MKRPILRPLPCRLEDSGSSEISESDYGTAAILGAKISTAS